jgi:nicotinate-nucleotide adenylyltransferase
VNIAVLGGTFDPIHNGHLLVAGVVRERLSPAEVVFVPAGHPWLKAARNISSIADRTEMVRLAIQGNRRYRLSTVETERSGPTYTVDTIRELKSQVSAQDELYFILGWDNLLDLPRWHKPQELISLCTLVAVQAGKAASRTLQASFPLRKARDRHLSFGYQRACKTRAAHQPACSAGS